MQSGSGDDRKVETMRERIEQNRIIWGLLLMVYVSLFVGGHIPHGKILVLVTVVLTLIWYLMLGHFRILFVYPLPLIHLLLFMIFCFASSLWALYPRLAVSKTKDLLWVLITTLLVSLVCMSRASVEKILRLVMWTGYLISVYAFLFYGVKNVLEALGKQRISNDAMNANTLGMSIAYAIIIQVYLILKERKIRWYIVFLIPSFLVLAVSESRKAFLLLVAGAGLLILMKNASDPKRFKRVTRFGLILILGVVALVVASRMPMFAGIIHRLETFLNFFSGEGKIDNSTLNRVKLIELGVEIWREHPLLGIGMDNARMIGGEVFNKGEYYLHNNYMELLADGGLIGFLLYYSMPFLLLTRAVRQQRRWVEDDAMICVILLLLMLVLDIGFVSYDSRTNYLLYLAIYIEFRNKHTDKDKILRESGDLT